MRKDVAQEFQQLFIWLVPLINQMARKRKRIIPMLLAITVMKRDIYNHTAEKKSRMNQIVKRRRMSQRGVPATRQPIISHVYHPVPPLGR